MNKVICTVCTEAIEKNLVLLSSKSSRESHEVFALNGSKSWKNDTKRFENHEKG